MTTKTLTYCCCFLLILLLINTLCHTQTITSNNYTITRQFANAIDYAIGKILIDPEFQQGMIGYGSLFSTPACSVLPYTRQAVPDAPTGMVLPRSSSSPLVLCYEADALFNWPKIHELAGKVMMKILNAKYNMDIPYTFLKVNTTLGYFNTLKSLVDTGACDVAIASTNLDTDRLSKVHFNCPYGSSSPGFLRSSLDNDTIIINSASDIDQPNVTVLTYSGSSYNTMAKSTYKHAKVISIASGYSECFDLILKKQGHILLGDATDLATWLKSNKDTCGAACFSKIYGEPFSFGSFITNNIRESSASHVSSTLFQQIILLIGLSVVLLLVNFKL